MAGLACHTVGPRGGSMSPGCSPGPPFLRGSPLLHGFFRLLEAFGHLLDSGPGTGRAAAAAGNATEADRQDQALECRPDDPRMTYHDGKALLLWMFQV